MKTIRTVKADGKEIIIGIDTLHIDPMASRRERARLFEASNEWKELKPKLERLRDLRDNFYNSKNIKKVSEREAAQVEIQAQIDILTSEVNNMKSDVEAAKSKAHDDGTTRFTCRKGEKLLEAHELSEIESKLETLSPGEYLLRTGEIIVDNRDKIFWSKATGKWERQVVVMLGEKIKDGMAHATELEPEEITEILEVVELERIAELSPEDKVLEKEIKLSGLAEESVRLRSKLEIQKAADPLAETQTWYEAEKTKLEDLYK